MAKQGAEKLQAVAMGHNKGQLARGLDKVMEIDIKIKKLKADRMNIINALDDKGFDPKEFSEIVKIKTKAKALSFKRGVNQMCSELEMPEEYSLTEEQMKKLREQEAAEQKAPTDGRTADEEEEEA